MKKSIIYSIIIIVGLVVSCSGEYDQIVPPTELSADEVFNDVARVRTFINPAYSGVRNSPWIELDYHTNNIVEVYGAQREAVSGATAESSPVSGEWNTAFTNIFRINEFLKYGFNITYDAFNQNFADNLKQRIRGEAFGLRAYYKWLLLKNFAGPSANDGSMLGIPIVDELLTIEDVNDVPRSTYLDSYKSIEKDLDSAYQYIDVLRYQGNGDVDGLLFTSRISREMILALRARMALFAASPAFNQISWDEAAQIAYDAIVEIDGGSLLNLQPYGNFNNTNNRDHLWRRGYSQNADLEQAHYPPSMFGRGEGNPSQNLVDVFPDNNGFPITHPSTVYDSDSPYENRDSRFERFIFYNGQNDYRNEYIEVYPGGEDAPGGIRRQATRTGYYMKKFLSEPIGLDPDDGSSARQDFKLYPIFSREGLYLDFAEAAVEAYGVTGRNGTMAFSAQDALQIIRARAGYSNDLYLDEADDFLNTFRELIRNERRIEFAFDGEYYYDVRRWMLPISDLQMPVMGVKVEKLGEDIFNYENVTVEGRQFTDRMYYNPIPRNQILNSNALIQNAGWE